eukprot:c3172_g1_i1 orf=632-1006(+)
MVQYINNQLQQSNWVWTQQTRLQQLSAILHKEGWWGMDDPPEGTTDIIGQVLLHYEENNAWQLTQQKLNGESRLQQRSIADWLVGDNKKLAKDAMEDEGFQTVMLRVHMYNKRCNKKVKCDSFC